MSGRNVAILAIHGVSEQSRGASIKAIASLLEQLDTDSDPRYEPFTSREVRIPIRPLAVSNPDTPCDDPGLDLTRRALRFYRGTREPFSYDTFRMESHHSADGTTVHVYECYWSDVARAGNGAFRFLADLYQILFRLSWLGYQEVRAGAPQRNGIRLWNAYRRFVWIRCTALTVAMPMAHVFLGAMACLVAALAVLLRLSPSIQFAVCIATAAISCWSAMAALSRGRLWSLTFWVLSLIAPLSLVLPLVMLWWPTHSGMPAAGNVQWFATWTALVVAGAVVALVRNFGRHHPQAPWIALALGSPLALTILIAIWTSPNDPEHIIRSYLTIVLGRTATLGLSPFALVSWVRYAWAVVLVAFLAGEIAGHWTALLQHDPTRAIWRSVRTASLTLTFSVFGFVITTTGLWGIILTLLRYLLPSTLSNALPAVGGDMQTGEMVQFVSLFLLLGLISFSIAVWALAPSVAAELRSSSTSKSEDLASDALGRWLTNGYRALTFAGYQIYLPLLAGAVLAIAWGLGFGSRHSLGTTANAAAVGIVRSLTIFYGLTILCLLTPLGRMTRITSGLHELVRVLLDVDNHLREHPRDSTPRARIAARLASMLRYICASDHGAPRYDALIIVGHSQGTVIAADLLRWIAARRLSPGAEPDIVLQRLGSPSLPVFLFTMGSPLRQMYHARFPFLYGWVAGNQKPAPPQWHSGDIAGHPEPAALGLRAWTNAFGSGDYVGRQLWRDPSSPYNYHRPTLNSESHPWTSGPDRIPNVSTDLMGTRLEFCVGPLAHTRYWDGSAPEIGIELDRLVRLAAESPHNETNWV